MRNELGKLGTKNRFRFTAEVDRKGYKAGWNGYVEETILLKNIRLYQNEDILTDHLWFNLLKQFRDVDIKEGDLISFDARVGTYKKGYFGDCEYFFMKNGYYPPSPQTDYRLKNPTNVRKENKDC